jgi:hypothetical protein
MRPGRQLATPAGRGSRRAGERGRGRSVGGGERRNSTRSVVNTSLDRFNLRWLAGVSLDGREASAGGQGEPSRRLGRPHHSKHRSSLLSREEATHAVLEGTHRVLCVGVWAREEVGQALDGVFDEGPLLSSQRRLGTEKGAQVILPEPGPPLRRDVIDDDPTKRNWKRRQLGH